MATPMEFSIIKELHFLDRNELPVGTNDSSTSGKGARSMIQAYHQHDKRLTYYEDPNDIATEKTLNGLIVEKTDLEALLNESLDADKFIILFAVSKVDLENNAIAMDRKRLTTILAPVKNNSIVTDYGGSTTLRNIFEPCPDKCHNDLLASYYTTFGIKP